MKKALFLDRDGVINVDKKYVHKISDFEFCEGIFELCAFFAKKDYELFVITNQSGIARGYYTEEDFERLSAFMREEFAKRSLKITRIYHCPHLEGCPCRKPQPGMLLAARRDFDLDLKHSLFIGDKLSDMQAGLAAGVGRLFLIGTARGEYFENFSDLKKLLSFIKKEEQ
ncbi:D-glycero-beta-D-manno-heptose 1,7-bisphosphate 7-phosphatase [Campylobacter sp.]|uniref:D-glycero-beta-D-manno-heptose 1,7-bisphosphate 7-phosphatase n=1 Tax=Campylobacter sp. TaxID=205 RepID=UPI0026DADAE0|nr:D-glycero-beta-D-manno-heptose 1,7-bisphosphate 7-phosphatase [Campylobacter sp.]MDO4673892.1 D-glycero-beta-D-manno-heptose 1,7-bisphosphate 7-phosphatase [Campylobacter sp.]